MMPGTDRVMPGEVHLWHHWIDEQAEIDERLAILDDDERARAARFRFERDRSRFVARRAFAREVLAGYVGVAPATIRYRISPNGRPELEPPCGVRFSTSHADGLAVVAVAGECLVGVDIERIRPITEAVDLADRLYSSRESGYVRSKAEPSRSEAFLALWTRKESYVKAVGAGLSVPLDGFDVLTRVEARTGRPRGPHGDLPFVFTSLDGLEGYVGAVTVSGMEIVIRHPTLESTAS